jgi:hypothetical protein
MIINKNSWLTPQRREEMACAVLGGKLSKAQAARVRTVPTRRPTGTGQPMVLKPRAMMFGW